MKTKFSRKFDFFRFTFFIPNKERNRILKNISNIRSLIECPVLREKKTILAMRFCQKSKIVAKSVKKYKHNVRKKYGVSKLTYDTLIAVAILNSNVTF